MKVHLGQLTSTVATLLSIVGVTGAYAAQSVQLLGTLNGPDVLVTIDPATGVGTQIGPLGIGFDDAMTALEYDSIHDVLYGAVSADVTGLFRVNPTTGHATRIGSPGTLGILATGMAHDPVSDIMYASGGDRAVRKNLYTVDRATGQSHLLGAVADINDSLQGLAFAPATQTLYGLDELAPRGARIVAIDPVTLLSTPVTGSISNENGWNALAFDPTSGHLFASANMRMYRIDPASGNVLSSVLVLSPENYSVGALTMIVPRAVPEPSTAFLFIPFALALVGSAHYARTRHPTVPTTNVLNRLSRHEALHSSD